MKKIKIIHINLSSGFAGTERHLVDLINFQSKNYETYLIKLKKILLWITQLYQENKIYKVSKLFKNIF